MDRNISIICFLLIAALMVAVIAGMAIYSSPGALLDNLLSAEVRFSLVLSLYTSGVGILIGCVIGIPAGHFLARHDFWGKTFLDSLINIPIVFPSIVGGLGLLILFGPLLGDTLSYLGIRFVFTPLGIILASFFVGTPFIVRTSKSTFESIDPKYEFIAMTVGCNSWQAFTKTTLRLAKNGLMAGILLGWTRALGEFGTTYLLAGSVMFKTSTMPITIFSNAIIGELDKALAGALLLVAISIMALVLAHKFAGKIVLR